MCFRYHNNLMLEIISFISEKSLGRQLEIMFPRIILNLLLLINFGHKILLNGYRKQIFVADF